MDIAENRCFGVIKNKYRRGICPAADDEGSLTLETAIVLPIFIFIFMFIYGIFGVVSAQNQVTHALVQSIRSLSLDSYITENVNSLAESDTNFWEGLDDLLLALDRVSNNEYFSSKTDWYSGSIDSAQTIAKQRFVGYLTGGDEDAADEKLKNLGIVDGLDGIEFDVSVEDETLTVTIDYEIKYLFDFFGATNIHMNQTMTAIMWE